MILTKYYFDQLLDEEKETILNLNRSIKKEFNFTNIANIQEVKTILEDYISLCRTIVPKVYESFGTEIQTLEKDSSTLNTGSKLINHLIKLVIPFQRLVHLPRGYSFKIKGPSILVTSSVNKTISKLLPQPISDILIPVALKRKLIYQSDYIYEHISSSKVITLFKLLKFKFKNIHYNDILFSKKMMEYDVKQFMEECKESCADLDKETETNIDDTNSISSEDENIEMDVKELEIDEGCRGKDSKLIDDSLLLPFGRPSEVGSGLTDILACQIEKRGVFSRKRKNTKNQRKRRKYMEKINIAPAEENKPQNWLSDMHLEEKSFPHLFPSGKNES